MFINDRRREVSGWLYVDDAMMMEDRQRDPFIKLQDQRAEYDEEVLPIAHGEADTLIHTRKKIPSKMSPYRTIYLG